MAKITREEALSEAIRLVNRTTSGIMATVDEQGMPQMRWMGFTTMADGLRKIYCLTARNTRKVEQLHTSPAVSWLFTNDEQGDIVSLFGQATVLEDAIVTQQVWDRLVAAGHPYIMSMMSENSVLEMVTVESRIDRLELLCPRLEVFAPLAIRLNTSSAPE